jgi:hypothetical protein
MEEGSSVAAGLDEHGHEQHLWQIRVTVAVKQAPILGKPVPHHRGHELLLGQVTHALHLMNSALSGLTSRFYAGGRNVYTPVESRERTVTGLQTSMKS